MHLSIESLVHKVVLQADNPTLTCEDQSKLDPLNVTHVPILVGPVELGKAADVTFCLSKLNICETVAALAPADIANCLTGKRPLGTVQVKELSDTHSVDSQAVPPHGPLPPPIMPTQPPSRTLAVKSVQPMV